MAAVMGILCALAAFSTITTSAKVTSQEERHVRKPGHSRHEHHMRFSQLKHHGDNASHHAKMGPDKELEAIQKQLLEAWKEKAHLEHLQSNLQSQKALLDKQKQFLSDDSGVNVEERNQVLQMYEIVKESRALTDKVRTSALEKTQDAMSEVMSIDTRADEQMAHNKQDITDLQLKIAQDVATNAEAERTKQRAKAVLAAALQEARYFEAVLRQAKTEKKESLNEDKSIQELVSKLEERNTHKDQEDAAAKENDQGGDEDDQDKHVRDDKVGRDGELLAAMERLNKDAN
eukprot:TRINITY_DN11997_c0_g1_i1.p1 TRINITY_DN11997_c0_g1~~TRINITY_DN11997_c0_g1_i1.p1  ORF type:complete len:289 (-),score=87.48 TRINITY_DN11997_c0_g1_i1:230-1096(-)